METTDLDQLVTPKAIPKLRDSLSARQFLIYIFIVLIAALGSYVVWARTRSIFSCPANGDSADRYIAYCSGANYGDYEHGAFWFGLEPALDFANKANVLFFGNSRMQKAFSTNATTDWFSAASGRYYLMGFSYYENMSFAEALLRRMSPQAAVYVINVDGFFDRTETPPAKTVLYDSRARRVYEGKRFWQRVQQQVCKLLPIVCGSKGVTFRSRETGAYDMQGATPNFVPVSYKEAVSQSEVDRETAAAIDFLKRFAQGKCVILTLVPYVGTKIGDANAVAAGLGMKLVAPDVAEGLRTGDGVHLDRPSSERWSEAFFQAAGPEIRSCLEKKGAAHS